MADHLGFTRKGAIKPPQGEPQPWMPLAGPRGSSVGPDRQATPLPHTSCPRAWPGPVEVTTGHLHPAYGGRLQLALAVSAPRGLRTGVTEADRVRSLCRQRPPQAGRPGPRLSSSPYSTRRSWGVRGQLIPDFLSQQSLAYKKRNPYIPLTLAWCAPDT